MLRLNAASIQILNPSRAEVHIDRYLHEDEIGTSNSSERHAAYASASETSFGSR